ncbi:MAG: lamin tail domain-containing protein [Clostridia bacterium]|nr:lamin tail domain-containing protein [Clostridia bacterium]
MNRQARWNKYKPSLILLAIILLAAVIFAVIAAAVTVSKDNSEVSLRISEIMTSNSAYPDPNGLFPDWIELENYGEKEIELGGYTVSDDASRAGYTIPFGTKLAPKSFLVIWCMKNGGSGYALFGLSSSGGETVVVKNSSGKVVDSVSTFSLRTDQSMCLSSGGWQTCDLPSPGNENTAAGHEKSEKSSGEELVQSDLKLVISELVAKNAGGLKDSDGDLSDWIELTNVSSAAIPLKGISVTNSVSDPAKWLIKSEKTLEPGASVVIFASGKNRSDTDELHASFRLSSEGETLWVFDSASHFICSTSYTELDDGLAWQLGDDGNYIKTYAQTPGKSGSMTDAEMNRLKGKLVINELCASYTVGKSALFEGSPDWIEIKNLSSEDIDLGGFWLTDDSLRPDEVLSGVVPAGGCALVLCDGGSSPEALHCDFSISTDGETVSLYSSWGALIDEVKFERLEKNFSLARNSSGAVSLCADPTPGYENDGVGLNFFYEANDSVGNVVINEVMINNSTYLPQSYGKCYDWIELKNVSSSAVSLSGYSLSTSRKKPGSWMLPDVTLDPGECYVVLASGKPELSTSAYKHTSFDLSSSGDSVFLFDPEENVADCLFAAQLPVGASYGRQDSKAGFFYFPSPTPGSSNSGGVRLVASSPVSDVAPGAYNNVQQLSVNLAGEGTIYYTLDGSVPSRSSSVYSGGFVLTRTTVVRSFCAVEGKLDSPVVSDSFIINENHTLPVVSLCTDPDNLWNYNTGIYVTGPGASDTWPYRGANYYKDWEKPANVSFYDDRGEGFSVDCGLKIFGNTGRSLAKKSFQLKFKKAYGTGKLVYSIFDNTDVNVFDSLVLRSGSQDYESALIRDALISKLCSDGMPETEAQAYRFCVLYLNGEYWGVYCFREKLDEDFVAAHYNVDPDDANVLGYMGTLQSGSSKGYKEVINYINSHDMSVTENYQWVADRVCLESYIDWFITQAYIGNSDLDNVRFFSANSGDKKWRWILYDFDLAFYNNTKPYSFLISPSMYADVSLIMRALVKNSGFRDLFLTQLGDRLRTTFSVEHVLADIDYLAEIIRPEMERERTRWDMTYSGWEKSLETLRTYIRGKSGVSRVQQFIDDVTNVFGLSSQQVEKYFGA